MKDTAIINEDITEQESLQQIESRVLCALTDATYKQKERQEKATEIIAEAFEERNYIYTTRSDQKSEVWVYKDGIYIPDGKTYIKEFSRQILKQAFTTSFVEQIIAKIETDTYIDAREFFLNEDVNLIPVENGILNLQTRELFSFSPKYRFFIKIPISYDQEKDCSAVKKFLSDILQDQSDLNVVQEIFGYLLYRDYRFEKAFMFTGNGRNGKSKLVELMKRFLGAENCADISLDDIQYDKFSASELFNKMANISADLSKTALKKTGMFKKLTGHDLISAARKFLTRVHFVNYAKLIFCANELPITYDNSDAFWNRWIIINFPYKFVDQQEFNLITKEVSSEDEERVRNLKVADTTVIEKISSREELSGLLNFALEGLQRLFKQGYFSTSSSCEDVKNIWLRKSDSLAAFISEMTEYTPNKNVTKATFKEEYVNFCRKHKIVAQGDKRIKKSMTTIHGINDSIISNNHYWLDLRIKAEGIINSQQKDETMDIPAENDSSDHGLTAW